MGPPRDGRQPLLRGELVWLRPSEPTDIDLFLRWMNDAEVSQFLATRAPLGRAQEERWIERVIEAQGKDSYHFVISRLEDDEPIGTLGLHEIDQVNGNAAVGIGIGEKRLWGKGYGTDAMNVVLDFAFGQLRLERVWLDVYPFNERAIRSYEKAGFTMEGTLRRAHYARGEYLDVHRMGVLREEWRSLPRLKSWELTVRDRGASPSSP